MVEIRIIARLLILWDSHFNKQLLIIFNVTTALVLNQKTERV
jgi:hypothetical protein